jgi:hypothetical protein
MDPTKGKARSSFVFIRRSDSSSYHTDPPPLLRPGFDSDAMLDGGTHQAQARRDPNVPA